MSDVKVPVLVCDQPTRFGYVYALVDQIQSGQESPLIVAVEWLGNFASSSYREDRHKALQALRAVRDAQVNAQA